MRTHDLVLAENQSGKLQSGAVPINPDNSWRTQSAYRVEHVQSMELVHPRPEAGANAAFRWADSNMNHEVKISWVGNDAPYRVSIISAPAGSSIGGVQTQVFDRVAIDGTDLFRHDIPASFAVFTCPAAGLTQGVLYSAKVLVESQSETMIVNLSFTVDDTKSVWFSGSGSDLADGTFAAPKQTFAHGFNLAGGDEKIYRYKAGTYVVNNGTPLNNATFVGHCKSHVGAEAGVIFNYDTGHMTKGGDDITIMKLKTIGGRPDVGNVRQFDFDSRVRRAMFHDVDFETNVVGTNGGDNPSAVFFGNIDPSYHEYISFSDCSLTAGSKTQMYTLFSVRKFSAINCHAPDMDTTTHNGAHAFHFKHGFQDCTMQFCSASGRTDTGLVWVSSQEPALCSNIDLSFSLVDYAATNTGFNSTRLNGQLSAGQPNAADLYVQRMSFVARQAGASGSSISAENFGTGTPLAKISACAWQSAGSTFVLGTGSEFVGTASEKVADINDLANDKKGLIGHAIYSTAVV